MQPEKLPTCSDTVSKANTKCEDFPVRDKVSGKILEEFAKKVEENKKESLNQSALHPMQQWDHAAYSLIYQQLAPKGFKKFTSGHWRGAEHADIPFLSKKQVNRCQSISAQLVRSFREQVKESLTNELKWVETSLAETPFYKFKARRFLTGTARGIQNAINSLDYISIPSKK